MAIAFVSCSGSQNPINPVVKPEEQQSESGRQIQAKPVSDSYWNTSVLVDGIIWTAHMDELGRVTRALGKGIIASEPISFVDSHPELFGVSSNELKLWRDETHDGVRCAIYRQTYGGMEIENTLLRIIYGRTGKLVSYGADVYAGYAPKGDWAIDSGSATENAKRQDNSKFISAAKYYRAKDNMLIPGWRIDLENNSYFIDATNGEIIETHQNRYEYDHKGHVSGGVKPWSPLDNDIIVDTYGARVDWYTYDQYFLGTVYTGKDGTFLFKNKEKWRVYTITNKNPWINVQEAWDSYIPSMSVSGWSYYNTFNEIDLNPWSQPAERNVLYYGTLSHDWFWTVEPEFNKMNFQLPAFVDKYGQCTAYAYTGGNPTIHFFQPIDECTNTGQSPTIIAHEYGHIYVSKMYLDPTGALHEALADSFANRMFENCMIGPDLYGAGTYRRVSNNDRMWPAAECDGETHCVGNVLAGAFWNLSDNIGHNLTDNIWHFSNYLNTVPFQEKAADVILLDDDDDDITNGSPHYNEIYDAFLVHHNLAVPAITNPQTSGVVIDIVPLNLPHVIPFSTGGSFSYHMKIQNLDDQWNNTKIWVSVEIPGTGWYGPIIPPGYLVHAPLTLNLSPHQVVDLDLTQTVPFHVPYDVFYYHVRVGQFVDHVNDVLQDEGVLEIRIF